MLVYLLLQHSTLESILRTADLDSELRISAYLQLMRCPSPATLTTVQQVLEAEQVNQVGSFIWTHLTNIKESSEPIKESLAAILDNVELRKSFDLDKRKFSRNVEWSYFSELLNAGGALDADIIFSQQSFLPRAAHLNLTADVFGQAYNVFELGGRAEGLQQLLEDVLHGGGRSRRSINNGVVSRLDDSFQPRDTETPRASYYVRMFGNELSYRDMRGFGLDSLRGQLNYLEWLMKLAEPQDFELTKSLGFMDTEWYLATASGLPLKLSAQGLTTTHLKVSGKLDVHRAVSYPPHIDIDGKLVPR